MFILIVAVQICPNGCITLFTVLQIIFLIVYLSAEKMQPSGFLLHKNCPNQPLAQHNVKLSKRELKTMLIEVY